MRLIYRVFFYYQVIWMSFEDIRLGFLTAKCLLFQVSMANFPISHYPCRTILDDAVRHVLRGRIPEGFSATLHISITLFICTCALATALVTSDLGTVFSFIGSTGGVLVIFIIPGFILLRNKFGQLGAINHADTEALQSQEEDRCSKRLTTSLRLGCAILLLCFGCLIFFVTAYVNTFGIKIWNFLFEEAAPQRKKISVWFIVHFRWVGFHFTLPIIFGRSFHFRRCTQERKYLLFE